MNPMRQLWQRLFVTRADSGHYGVETRWSGSENAPSPRRMKQILTELDVPDFEHPDTWLTHGPSGWTLRADEDGYLVLTNRHLDDDGSHLANVPRQRVLELWIALSKGDIDTVRKQPWISGSPPVDPVKVAKIAELVAESQRQQDREFYSILGEESTTETCRADGCTRGRISVSWFCKVHHFEQLKGRKCPYSD